MRIWFITIGEPLPTDNLGADRLLRCGILASIAADNGHDVTWWTSTFDHVRKQHRYHEDKDIAYRGNFRIRLLHSCGYKRNISISRLIDHQLLAKKFSRQAEQELEPDIIISSLPTLELCLAAARYGKKRNLPVVLDVRDLWPDIFLELAPKALRPFARIALSYLYYLAGRSCKDAAAITGLTAEFVDWGLAKAGRPATAFDRVFPMAYMESHPSDAEKSAAEKKIATLALEKNEIIVCFFGTFGRQFDFNCVLEAARILVDKRVPVKFVLCGAGDQLEAMRYRSSSLPNVILPGWLSRAEIWLLMRKAHIGLAPYRDSRNFRDNIPNKPIEYLSSGLPVLLPIEGRLRNLLTSHGCGLFYDNRSPESLASLLQNVAENPRILDSMGQPSIRLYQDQFVAETVYAKMLEYLQLLAQKFSRAPDHVGAQSLLGDAEARLGTKG